MSICPKNKSSKGRRDKRRANWKMSAPTLVKCSKCGALMMPHSAVPSGGETSGGGDSGWNLLLLSQKNHLLFIYAFSIVRMNLPSSNCLV